MKIQIGRHVFYADNPFTNVQYKVPNKVERERGWGAFYVNTVKRTWRELIITRHHFIARRVW